MASMSPVTRAGAFLFISGQVSLDAEGAVVGAEDPAAQVDQVFANIASVLASEGADFSNVVQMRAFLTDPAAFPPYAAVKSTLFEDLVAPASTAVIVSALLLPELLIEVEVVAWLG